MKRGFSTAAGMVIAAVLIGVSISAGPFAWVVIVLAAPLIVGMVLAGGGIVHGSADVARAEVAGGLGSHADTPELRRSVQLRHAEQVARAEPKEYSRLHHDD